MIVTERSLKSNPKSAIVQVLNEPCHITRIASLYIRASALLHHVTSVPTHWRPMPLQPSFYLISRASSHSLDPIPEGMAVMSAMDFL